METECVKNKLKQTRYAEISLKPDVLTDQLFIINLFHIYSFGLNYLY